MNENLLKVIKLFNLPPLDFWNKLLTNRSLMKKKVQDLAVT